MINNLVHPIVKFVQKRNIPLAPWRDVEMRLRGTPITAAQRRRGRGTVAGKGNRRTVTGKRSDLGGSSIMDTIPPTRTRGKDDGRKVDDPSRLLKQTTWRVGS